MDCFRTREASLGIKKHQLDKKLNEKSFAVDQTCPWPLKVSESLTRLQREQLQKFAQYLIAELPQQILPTAQRILDELLDTSPSGKH